MSIDFMDGWDEYPRRSFDRESSVRAIATWIDSECSIMPYTVLHCFDGFRVGVRDPEDEGMIHAPSERIYSSAAVALAELGELIDTAMRRIEGNEPWPEGPALEEIRLYQKAREVDKLNTMATLFIQREPHIANEIKDGSKPGRLCLDAASLPECLWAAFEAEGTAFNRELEEEVYVRVKGQKGLSGGSLTSQQA